MRILVCGGRDYADADKVRAVLGQHNDAELAHGDARGADSLAAEYGKSRGWVVTAFPAAWKVYGKQAGILRNARMLADFKPELVIAFPGGRGTADMVSRSRRAGVTVLEVAP